MKKADRLAFEQSKLAQDQNAGAIAARPMAFST